MKLRYILTSIVAVLTLATACEKETQNFLSEVQVSSSYVAIPAAGGSQTIVVNATSSWSVNDIPDWLTVSPASGPAGETVVSFNAPSTKATKEGSVNLVCDGKTQIINVIQLTEKQELPVSACATVLAGADGVTYKIQGVCTKIANTSYGNFYIDDGTGEVYVYGTVDATGAYNWNSFGIEVGDVVTVEGPKSTYNGTVELVDATFKGVIKSLLSVEPANGSISKEGGNVVLEVEYKGDDLKVIPQVDWISLANVSIQSGVSRVTLKIAENTGDPRTGEVIFESSIPGQTSTATATISQAGVSGTLANPFSVFQAIDFAKSVGATTEEAYYVKGVVSKIQGDFTEKYGNGSFWISDDGYYHDKDLTLDFEGYNVYWLDNQKWVEGMPQLSVGDEVIICGKLTVYNGLAETSSKEAYLYSINGLKDSSEGLGSEKYPLTIAGVTDFVSNNGAPSRNYYVKGKVSKILYTFSASYGTGTFWLSDDGTFKGDESGKSTTAYDHDFEAYSVYWLGNQPWVEGNPQVEVGDDVVVYGALTLYNKVVETSSKKAHVFSINGVTE